MYMQAPGEQEGSHRVHTDSQLRQIIWLSMEGLDDSGVDLIGQASLR